MTRRGSMNRKTEMLETLLESYELMMKGVSAAELAKSGLFSTWLQQVSSALMITGMEVERQIWEDVRAITVSLHERKSLEAYGTGMRAILLGILYTVEESKDEP
jgi:hypothetical protein